MTALPEWVKDQQPVRAAEEMATEAYADWARHYAYTGSSDPAAICTCSACQAVA